MNSFVLKLILFFSLLSGNIAIVLVDGEKYLNIYSLLRAFSMAAVPIACFLMVEGFFYSSDRKKYAVRLIAFGLIAELPFLFVSLSGLQKIEAAIKGRYGDSAVINQEFFLKLTEEVGSEKAFYFNDLYLSCARYSIDGLMTLAVCLLMIWLVDRLHALFENSRGRFIASTTVILLLFLALLIIIPFENPLPIAFFAAVYYYLRGNKPAVSVMSLLLVISFYSSYGMLMQSGVLIGCICVMAYNGRHGEYTKKLKWLFYAAYPVQYLLAIGLNEILSKR